MGAPTRVGKVSRLVAVRYENTSTWIGRKNTFKTIRANVPAVPSAYVLPDGWAMADVGQKGTQHVLQRVLGRAAWT